MTTHETYQAMNARHAAERAGLQSQLEQLKARHAAERADWYHANQARKAAEPKRPVGRPRKVLETDEYGRQVEYRDGERRVIQ